MVVLGIETATSVCGVALVKDGVLVGESRVVGHNLHNERLHVMMKALLAQASVTPDQLEGVAVSLGPGSFTGLRIGLAAAKGLVFALEARLVGVPTLEVLAEQAPHTAETVCALIPAKANVFYLGHFRRRRGKLQTRGTPQVVSEALLPEAIPAGAVLVGPGCAVLQKSTLRRLKKHAMIDLTLHSLPSAATVAFLGHRMLLSGHCDDPCSLEPIYVQEFLAVRPKPIVPHEART